MVTLEEIKNTCISNDHYNHQLHPFLEYFETGDFVKCWQTIYGYLDEVIFPIYGNQYDLEIAKLANNISLWHYENGTKYIEMVVINNIRNGYYKEYREDGKLSDEGLYENDLRQGEWIHYNNNGTIVKYRCVDNISFALDSNDILIFPEWL